MIQYDYTGVTIGATISSARPHEADHWGSTVEKINADMVALLKSQLTGKYPGATVTVSVGGDQPSAEIGNVGEYRLSQAMKYDIQKLALKIKWDVSTAGLGMAKA